MIELIAAAVSGAVVGGGVVYWQMARLIDHINDNWGRSLSSEKYDADRATDTLTALRSNCFIPDERGVKVRYSQASAQRRVKAETPKEVV